MVSLDLNWSGKTAALFFEIFSRFKPVILREGKFNGNFQLKKYFADFSEKLYASHALQKALQSTIYKGMNYHFMPIESFFEGGYRYSRSCRLKPWKTDHCPDDFANMAQTKPRPLSRRLCAYKVENFDLNSPKLLSSLKLLVLYFPRLPNADFNLEKLLRLIWCLRGII